MIFYDTETCGLHGMAVLIQWAEDDGEVQLFEPWTNPISDTLRLIEKFMSHDDGVVGFNLAFDHFHLCKLYTTFSLWHDHSENPENIIDELAELEMQARDGLCLKPQRACDLMLHARRGPYQSTMDRGDIRIRRVPTALAWQLAEELERRIKLKDIYFARRKNKRVSKWQIYDVVDSDGDTDTNFKDIVLKFAPSSALKALATDALNLPIDEVLLFHDVDVDEEWLPEEYGYAPFARAIGTKHDWKGAWPEKISHHISHWAYHERARKYAKDDVIYTRSLYKHFGSPPPGDVDSELTCMVGAVRWRGFKIDIPRLQELRKSAARKMIEIPTAPAQVRNYVNSCLDTTEQLVLRGSTKKIVLEAVAKLKKACPDCNAGATLVVTLQDTDAIAVALDDVSPVKLQCNVSNKGQSDCEKCSGTGTIQHPAALRAQTVLDARAAAKEIEIYDKLLKAGRFHASFKVIGSLSSRMSGTDGLNAQGIKKTKEVRSCFPLAWSDFVLCGGDFAGFEVTIAEAVYNDAKLREMLLTCERCDAKITFVCDRIKVSDYLGKNTKAHYNYVEDRQKDEAKRAKKDSKYVQASLEDILEESIEADFICKECGSKDAKKIHALFGLHCYPGYTYETLKATSGTKDDKYTRAKSGVFAMMYGGNEHTLADRLGVPTEIGAKALASFHREFPGVRRFQQEIFDAFCSMRQPGGIGSKVEWHEPADYRETMFGFRRYFTLENQICKTLFELANKPPRAWQDEKIKVMRRDRVQTATGAVQSALYGAAFQIQAANMRAAANHDIQSSGATITKFVQAEIWKLQPSGINNWEYQPMNIHDEIMCPTLPENTQKLKQAVHNAVEKCRPKVPLIKMEWVTGLKTWAEKG